MSSVSVSPTMAWEVSRLLGHRYSNTALSCMKGFFNTSLSIPCLQPCWCCTSSTFSNGTTTLLPPSTTPSWLSATWRPSWELSWPTRGSASLGATHVFQVWLLRTSRRQLGRHALLPLSAQDYCLPVHRLCTGTNCHGGECNPRPHRRGQRRNPWQHGRAHVSGTHSER